MKYRIEIEKVYPQHPRPWEWRIYWADDGEPFSDVPNVTGCRGTAQRALDEADVTLSLMTPEESEALISRELEDKENAERRWE